jgi:hypothetical protein
MMSDAVSNKGDNENAVAILKEGLERHKENGFAVAVFGEMVRSEVAEGAVEGGDADESVEYD